MTTSLLARRRRIWRIGDREYPLYSAYGALHFGARWNSPGVGVIYAAASLEGAMLEVRVHTNGLPPPRRHGSIWIDLPKGLSYERIGHRTLKGWRTSEAVSRAHGDAWARSGRSCLLFVPSVVVPGAYRNVLINPPTPRPCESPTKPGRAPCTGTNGCSDVIIGPCPRRFTLRKSRTARPDADGG